MAVYLLICAVGMFFAFRVEKYKRKFDIQTYKEINAFLEGKSLDEIEKVREEGKRPYQKILLAVGAGILALLMCGLLDLIFRAI